MYTNTRMGHWISLPSRWRTASLEWVACSVRKSFEFWPVAQFRSCRPLLGKCKPPANVSDLGTGEEAAHPQSQDGKTEVPQPNGNSDVASQKHQLRRQIEPWNGRVARIDVARRADVRFSVGAKRKGERPRWPSDSPCESASMDIPRKEVARSSRHVSRVVG